MIGIEHFCAETQKMFAIFTENYEQNEMEK